MAFDDALRKYVGDIGRYQYLAILAINVFVTPASFGTMEMAFTQATPAFWPIVSGQKASGHNASQGDPCDCGFQINGSNQKQQCREWGYDDSVFESTLVTQFHLVCQQAWVVSVASTVYFVSFMAVFPIGYFSDRFGRRPCLIFCVVLNISSRIAQIWSPSVTVYIISRFFVGLSHMGGYSTGFVLGSELVGPSKRLIAGVPIAFSWVLGLLITEGFAFALRSRFYLELALTITVACTLPLLWFIPESPRWLASQGRYEDSIRVLRKMAAVNGRNFPRNDDESLLRNLAPQSKTTNEQDIQCYRFRSALSSRIIVLRTIAVSYIWLAIVVSYYGLTLNSGKLAGDIYLNTFLTSIVEVPADIAVLVTLSTASGRAFSLSISMVLTAVFLLASVPLSAGTAATALSLLGKLCSSYAFLAVYIYTCELFPTTIRNIGFGFCSFSSRIGSILVPTIVSIFPDHVGGALLIGSISLVAGLLVLCLPETRAAKLPQTIADAEAMHGFLLSRCRSNKDDTSAQTPDEDAAVLDVST